MIHCSVLYQGALDSNQVNPQVTYCDKQALKLTFTSTVKLVSPTEPCFKPGKTVKVKISFC